jgi:serine/threonine-protein kinase
MTSEEGMVKAKAAAQKALALDDGLAEAHNSLAQIAFFNEYDWAGSERESRRALSLNPSYASAHDQFGTMLALQGRLDEGLSESRRAVELDPLAPQIMSDLAWLYGLKGDFEPARAQARKVEELDPSLYLAQSNFGWIDLQEGHYADAIRSLQKAVTMDSPSFVHAWLGYAYGISGDHTRAAETLHGLKKKSRDGEVPPDLAAIVHIGMGDHERALDELERAYAAHSQMLTFLGMDRMFDPIRSEPRFVALAKKMGFEN